MAQCQHFLVLFCLPLKKKKKLGSCNKFTSSESDQSPLTPGLSDSRPGCGKDVHSWKMLPLPVEAGTMAIPGALLFSSSSKLRAEGQLGGTFWKPSPAVRTNPTGFSCLL